MPTRELDKPALVCEVEGCGNPARQRFRASGGASSEPAADGIHWPRVGRAGPVAVCPECQWELEAVGITLTPEP